VIARCTPSLTAGEPMLPSQYPPTKRGRLVVWGLLGSYPFGGMSWQVLHHLAGLRCLGARLGCRFSPAEEDLQRVRRPHPHKG
jgi:hypothetical protein